MPLGTCHCRESHVPESTYQSFLLLGSARAVLNLLGRVRGLLAATGGARGSLGCGGRLLHALLVAVLPADSPPSQSVVAAPAQARAAAAQSCRRVQQVHLATCQKA